MEYVDEDYRPRFQLQTSAFAPSRHKDIAESVDKKLCILCVTLGILILAYAYNLDGLSQILIAWIGFALILGPFAPPAITGGEIAVGQGETLEEPQLRNDVQDRQADKKSQRSKVKKTETQNLCYQNWEKFEADKVKDVTDSKPLLKARVSRDSEKEWTKEEIEILRKQLLKNPPGKPGRYEAIAEAFGGSRSVESVARQTKLLAEKKDEDSFAKFLAQRRASDISLVETEKSERIVEERQRDLAGVEKENAIKITWSCGDDIALLNALKAFPKDVALRWDKIAAAVPGKSKAQCMKRVSELKQNFRNSKTNES